MKLRFWRPDGPDNAKLRFGEKVAALDASGKIKFGRARRHAFTLGVQQRLARVDYWVCWARVESPGHLPHKWFVRVLFVEEEGVSWCRGWGVDAEALHAASLLANSQA